LLAFAVNASIESKCSFILEPTMSTLTIRNLEPNIKDKLRLSAAVHGRSMEEEVRTILRQALSQPAAAAGLGSRIHTRFAALGGAQNISLPPRTEMPRAAHCNEDGVGA
jgi:antitoxin FitA